MQIIDKTKRKTKKYTDKISDINKLICTKFNFCYKYIRVLR